MISGMNRRTRLRAGLLHGACIAALMGFGASGALAQTAAVPPTNASDSTPLEEVIVTAERRSESVQQASQSITAISGAQLQEQGLTNVQDALAQVAGVSLGQDGAGLSEVFLRGMAAQGGVAATTGFYLNDTSLPAPANSTYGHEELDPNLYDVKDVEVLRGPQGTLYGASSMGGTIRINTNQPDLNKFGASVQLIGSGTEGGGPNGTFNAMVNIPLVQDKLALRIVGSDAYTSGWIDRIDLGPTNFPVESPPNGGFFGTRGNVLGITPVSVDKDSNSQTIQGGRATLLWAPTDNFSVAPLVLYQKLYSAGAGLVDIPPGSNYEAHYQPFNVAEPYSDTVSLVSLPIKYTVDNINLESTTSHTVRNSSAIQDASEDSALYGNAGYYFTPPATPMTYAQLGPAYAYETNHTADFTEELRASSTGDSPFQWLFGFYYENYNSNTTIAASPISTALSTYLGSAPNIPWYYIYDPIKITQYAGFGEASYKLGDFKATVGLRYFDYSEPAVTDLTLFAGQGATAQPTAGPLQASKASGINPRVNLAYAPDPDLTLYVQAAKGFRPGVGLPPAPPACNGFGVPTQTLPDTVWSYEGGEKAMLMDGRLTLNGDVYYEKWTGIQETIDSCNGGYSYSGNAGVAGIYGSELEVALHVTPEIVFLTSVGFADAKFTSVTASSGFVVGQELPLVSRLTHTTSIVYTHHLNDDYNLVLRATDIYKSSQYFVGYETPETNFINLRVGLASKNKMSLWMFANNVVNSTTPLGISNVQFGEMGYGPNPPVAESYRDISPQPRTIGLELDYAFGAR